MPCLLLVRRPIRGSIGWLAGFLRVWPGDYFVFGIQPGAQIYKLASFGAEGKECCLFRLVLNWCFNGFVTDWTSVFHTIDV